MSAAPSAGAPGPAPAVLERLVRRGRAAEVRAALAGLDEPARKELAPVVKDLARRDVRERLSWQARQALVVARAGTVTGAAAVADVLRVDAWSWSAEAEHVVGALLDRRPPWLPAVVDRLAGRVASPLVEGVPFAVVEALRVASGLPRPTEEAYLTGLVGSLGSVEDHPDLPGLLRDDPALAALVPAALGATDVGQVLQMRATTWSRTPGRPAVPTPAGQTWPGALARAAADGTLERGTLLQAVLEALLRGGKREHVAGLLAVHDALAPATEEVFGHRRTYVRLLADGPGTVATASLRLLRAAAGDGVLDDATVLEAVEGAVRRREKGLATGGLSWAQQLSRGRTALPGRADDVARAAAAGLVHERRDVQERTLRVLAPLVPGLSPDALDEVRAAAADLPAVLRTEAEATLGPPLGPAPAPGAQPDEPPAAAPAPGPPAARVPVDLTATPEPAVRDLSDLADAVAEHLEQLDPRSAERVLDGVSRFAVADPAGFRDAVRPFEGRLDLYPRAEREALAAQGVVVHDQPVVRLLRAVLAGRARGLLGRPGRSRVLAGWTVRGGTGGCLDARARETAERVLDGRGGALVAVPTARTGRTDPGRVLDRLREAAGGGVAPGPLDLEQTLLRLPRAARDDAGWLQELRVLGSPAAAWLAGATERGLPEPGFEVTPVPPTLRRWGQTVPSTHAGVPVVDVRPPAAPPGSLVAQALAPAPRLSVLATQDWWEAERGTSGPLWVLLAVPQHREVVAAHLLVPLLGTGRQCPPDLAEALALLPEAGGPTGFATAAALGWAASGSDLAARTAAADALRGFAAQGGLDGPAAGRVLGALLLQPAASVARVATTLAEAARGDVASARLTWDLLAAALPVLLPSGRRGVADLVGLAAEVGAEVGARGAVEGLDAVARPGSTRLATEARRLRDVLAR